MLFDSYINKLREGFAPNSIDDSENPWNGLSPYSDPETSGDKHPKMFCGRDNDIFKLSQQIKNKIFVTVYGKSGNGKTSLLNAGVCPRLRTEQFFPISIRLGTLKNVVSFQQHIISEIEKQTSIKQEVIDIVKGYDDDKIHEIDYLWNYFARHRFYKGDKMVFPVIILDQFEECFRERQTEVATLLKQIYYMMNESHALSDCNIDGELYEYYFNFRFVVAIREDDLFKLEDTIDSNYLSAMKENRFRLRAISEKGAKEVILNPGKDIFCKEDKEDIVKTIISMATEQDGTIGSNVLSLLCSRIYVSKLKDKINEPLTLEYVKTMVSNKPLEQYYAETTKDLTRKERTFLEDSFVDVSGRRCSVSKANLKKNIRDWKELLSGTNKILQESDNGRIELIHDSFCPILEEKKYQREEKWRSIVEHLLLGITSIIGCFSLYFVVSLKKTGINIPTILFFVDLVKIYFVLGLGIGIIRKCLRVWYCILVGILSIVPFLSVLYLNPKIEYTYSTILFIILNGVLIVYALITLAMTIKDREKSKNNMNFVFKNSFVLWVGAIMFSMVIFFGEYRPPAFAYVCILFLFFVSTENDMGLYVTLLTLPLYCIFWEASDISLFVFYDLLSVFITMAIQIGYCILGLVHYVSNTKKMTPPILAIVVYCALLFGLYLLIYKYKLVLLLIWTTSIIILSVIFRREQKHPILNCLILLVSIIGGSIYFCAYNPQIKGINPEIQFAHWRWNSVIKENDGHIEVLNARTGKKIIETDFDGVDDDKWLFAKTKYSFKLQHSFRVYHSDSVLYYQYFPNVEYDINQKLPNNDLVAMTYCSYRDTIFKHLTSGEPMSPMQYPNCIDQLIENETQQILNLLNTDYDKNNRNKSVERQTQLFQLLCRSLSVSFLKNVSNDIKDNGDMKLLFDAFERFVKSHWELMIGGSLNNGGCDYITLFQTIANMYLNVDNLSVKDSCFSRILSPLKDEYKDIKNDYNYQINLEKMIEKLNEIRIKSLGHQLEQSLIDDPEDE